MSPNAGDGGGLRGLSQWIQPGGYKEMSSISWLTNSVLVYELKCGGGREFAISQPMCTGAHIHFGDPTHIKPMYVCLHATCICTPKSRKIQFTEGKSGNDKIPPSATNALPVLYPFLRNIKETKRLLESWNYYKSTIQEWEKCTERSSDSM